MNIMFICTGNICRSAMAHLMLEKRLKDLNKTDINVFSCGISAYDGDGATYNTIEALKRYDVDGRKHRATNIRNSNIEDMDIILCATNSHKNAVIRMYPSLEDKVYTIKEYCGYVENKDDIDILDPWGYDMEVFKKCADDISICIELLLQKIYEIY